MDLVAAFAGETRRLIGLTPRLADGPYLVALSGGSDSTALLVLALEAGFSLRAAHLDHGMRPDSDTDAVAVWELCRSLGVPLFAERLDVPALAARRGWSLEDAARRLRYDFLARAARQSGASAILTGHTLDDDAETVLLQLLRGTARATGIPPRRGRVLRPLLAFRREALESLLRERGIGWLSDESNRDERFTRNWLRHQVLPLLRERYPDCSATLARYARLSREEDAFLEEVAANVPAGADWRREPEAVQRRLVRRALEAAGVPPDAEHVTAIVRALSAGAVSRVSLPGAATARTAQGHLAVLRQAVREPALEWPQGIDFSAFPAAELRTRRPGDRVNLPGGTRKLSDLLIDRKVPREERDSIPLVASGGEVLWVGLQPPVLDQRLGRVEDSDARLMGEALALAREAAAAGEVPVGAVVVRDGVVIGRGRNRSRAGGDMTLHAEVEAIREACAAAGPYLEGCSLYVTLEPCPMCLGAAIEARVALIAYGAENAKAGALGGVRDVLRASWTHKPAVKGGVRARESAAMLSEFFARLRD